MFAAKIGICICISIYLHSKDALLNLRVRLPARFWQPFAQSVEMRLKLCVGREACQVKKTWEIICSPEAPRVKCLRTVV